MSPDREDPGFLLVGRRGDPGGHPYVRLDPGLGEQRRHPRPLLRGEPERARRRERRRGPPGLGELPEPGLVRGLGAEDGQLEQEVVELLGVPAVGACLLADPRDRVRVELREIPSGLRQTPPERHGPRPPLLERRVVEEGVRAAVEDLVGERRGLGRLAEEGLHGAAPEAVEESNEPVHVGRFVQTVVHRLAHDRVVRDLDGPGARVLLAARERGEHRGHEVVRLHALDRGRRPPPAALPQHHERAAEIPAPSHLEHRRQEQRLCEDLRRVLGGQELRHVRRAGSFARGRGRARPRRRWPRPGARSRSAGRSASGARARGRG